MQGQLLSRWLDGLWVLYLSPPSVPPSILGGPQSDSPPPGASPGTIGDWPGRAGRSTLNSNSDDITGAGAKMEIKDQAPAGAPNEEGVAYDQRPSWERGWCVTRATRAWPRNRSGRK